MPNDISPANIFNPMLVWADLGLRAADMTLASSQNLSDGVDRLARAGAGDDSIEARSVDAAAAFVTPLGVDLPARLHRTAFEMFTNGWVQWMSSLGSVASFAAGLGQRAGGRSDSVEAFRAALLPVNAPRFTPAAMPARERGAPRRETHAESGTPEHAAASSAPQRRRAGGRSATKARKSGTRARARNS